MKALVLGAGIMGLASAWALRRRGWEVTVLEAGRLPRPEASSHAPQRLIRHPYGPLPGYAAMVDEAYRAWERLWEDLGARHYAHTGTLVLAAGATDWLESSAAGMTAAGVPFERLPAPAVAERFPMLDARALGSSLYAPSGGVLLADRILRDLASHLAERGVALRAESTVRAIGADGLSLTLADGEPLRADALVVAAGPWTSRLWPDLAARLRTTRQVEAHLPDPDGRLRGCPLLIDIHPEVGFYLAPPAAGLPAKTGDHRFGPAGDPDADRAGDPRTARRLAERAATRLRGVDPASATPGRACYYTVTADERFLAEPLDARGRAWRLAGFSGHGFKFGAALGLRVADAIEGRLPAEALTAWAAGRAA